MDGQKLYGQKDKIYITKYALTKGILTTTADAFTINDDGKGVWFEEGIIVDFPDWHWHVEDAIARAEELRLNKIKALKKNLEKLEKLDFTSCC